MWSGALRLGQVGFVVAGVSRSVPAECVPVCSVTAGAACSGEFRSDDVGSAEVWQVWQVKARLGPASYG